MGHHSGSREDPFGSCVTPRPTEKGGVSDTDVGPGVLTGGPVSHYRRLEVSIPVTVNLYYERPPERFFSFPFI